MEESPGSAARRQDGGLLKTEESETRPGVTQHRNCPDAAVGEPMIRARCRCHSPLSFSASPYLEFPPRGSALQWYRNYFSCPDWVSATILSFKIDLAMSIPAMTPGTSGHSISGDVPSQGRDSGWAWSSRRLLCPVSPSGRRNGCHDTRPASWAPSCQRRRSDPQARIPVTSMTTA